MPLYSFHRADGWYPVALRDDANAECNPGTIKVCREPSGRIVWLHGEDMTGAGPKPH